MTVGFLDKAVLQPLQDGSKKWRVYQDLVWTHEVPTSAGARLDTYVVPKGFPTDLATIPPFLWPVFPPYGQYTSAAVLHDWVCENPAISRLDGDRMFLEAMKHDNVPMWKRWIIYSAVRAYAIVNRIK